MCFNHPPPSEIHYFTRWTRCSGRYLEFITQLKKMRLFGRFTKIWCMFLPFSFPLFPSSFILPPNWVILRSERVCILIFWWKLPAVRRTQYITKRSKFLQQNMFTCNEGHIVNINTFLSPWLIDSLLWTVCPCFNHMPYVLKLSWIAFLCVIRTGRKHFFCKITLIR